MTTRMTSTHFVGRSAELAELEAALLDAAHGRSSLALVAGDSGVGKSRLVSELAGRARGHGARVLSGDSVELGEGELPYAPLLGALRPLVRAGDPALEALPEVHRAALAAILPGLPGPASAEPAEQAAVFEALLALLDTLSAETPVLLLVEDLHWADSSTRSFIAFLARTLCLERVLVIATYRSDELHRRHPLRPLLGELTRDPGTLVVELLPFTREELAEQLQGILATPAEPALAERVYSRSEGNALFTEEILAAGLDGRGALPPTLRDALMLRVERLPAPAQDLLRWLACQPALDHALLAEVGGLDEAALRDALREAVASQIVVTLPDGTYSFRHALLREVVHDDLLPGERIELHAALAEALEARVAEEGPGAHLAAQIAHHRLAAGDQPAALASAVRAADAAVRVNAFGEALALLERVLGLWERVPNPEQVAGAGRIALLARAASAADHSGDPLRQEALLQSALALMDAERDPHAVAALLERLHWAQWELNRQEESVATLDRALGLLEPDELSAERAALVAAKARARMLQGRFDEATTAAREALTAANAMGDTAVETRALNTLGVALAGSGDVEGGAESLRRGLELAHEADLPNEQSRAYLNLADVLHVAGRSDDALAVAHRGLEELTSKGFGSDWLQLLVAEISFEIGDWEAARRAMPPDDRRYVGITQLQRRVRRSEQLLGRGDHPAVRRELDAAERAARDSTEPQFVGPLGVLRAELERRCGDLTAARAAVDESLDRIEYCSDDLIRIAQVAAAGLRVEADAAESARDRRDPEAEAEARKRAGMMAERVRLASVHERPTARALLAETDAEEARAEGREAAWDAAVTAWEAAGRPYAAAYCGLRQAEARLAAGDRTAAAAAAGAALERARDLGSQWLVSELESLAAGARLPLAGLEPVAAPDPEDDPFGLTAREREVLALVSSGATNREIGERLHMAEKTASVHVSRILAKLDVRSRTEAAAVAHRQGMAGTTA